jgi:hypothetical protein
VSVHVLNEVLEHADARGYDLCVLIALADAASHDGVTWLPIESGDPKKKSIARRAHCSRDAAIDAIARLREAGELETRKVRRGRSTITVYRVTVGSVAKGDVDYDRLPFELPLRFGHGGQQPPSTGADEPAPDAATGEDQAEVQGGQQPPSTEQFTVADEADSQWLPAPVQGGAEPEFTVAASPSRVKKGPETSEETAAGPVREAKSSERSGISAAAVEGPASPALVQRVVASLRQRDAGTVKSVEQLAVQLPAGTFLEIAGRVDKRRQSGGVTNDAGLLIKLLRIEIAELHAADHAAFLASVDAPPPRESWIEVVKRDYPDAYVRAMAKGLTDQELAEVLGGDHFDSTLRELARAVRDGEKPCAPILETSSAARQRWIDEYAAALPLEDVRQIVADWNDVDDVERTMLLERAEAAREPHAHGSSNEAAA